MITVDLHTHTTYCDGKNTPEEMVKAAIEKGLSCLGFSVHSYTYFDESYCIKKDRVGEYKSEINLLKEKYKDKIKILCGVEQDYYSDEPTDGYDYVIGSVHYIKTKDVFLPVDKSGEILADSVKKYFKGDFYSYVEEYFKNVSDVVYKNNVDIIGHFDLITKFNENGKYFDEKNERYIASYKAAVDRLIPYNIPFEINTGAITRGYRSTPYPSVDILRYIKEKNGRVILSSDSHSSSSLCFGFEECEKTAREIGFGNVL